MQIMANLICDISDVVVDMINPSVHAKILRSWVVLSRNFIREKIFFELILIDEKVFLLF